MISILFEKSKFKKWNSKEYHNFSQKEGIAGRDRWYCCYIDTPDSRFGQYKIVIVLQRTIFKTGLMLFHEFIHFLSNLIYGEKEIGNKVHQYFDVISFKIKNFYMEKL